MEEKEKERKEKQNNTIDDPFLEKQHQYCFYSCIFLENKIYSIE